MLKTMPKNASSDLIKELQNTLAAQIEIPEPKPLICLQPFFNFVCNIIEILREFAKSNIDVSLNTFIVDLHIRNSQTNLEAYRKLMNLTASWRKHADTDEVKLITSMLTPERNGKNAVKLFLRMRKILLKNINLKILQEIKLTHEDAVTIVHMLNFISLQEKRLLVKQINEYFIKYNKLLNSAKFNAAVVCEYFLEYLNPSSIQSNNPEQSSAYISNRVLKEKSNNYQFLCKGTNKENEMIEPKIKGHQMSFSGSLFGTKKDQIIEQFFEEENSQSMHLPQSHTNSKRKEQFSSINFDEDSSILDFSRCLKQLNLLKQKDIEMDNRFKKFSSVKQAKTPNSNQYFPKDVRARRVN